MDETRLDLRAADQERLARWEREARESSRQVHEAMRMGVGMYPIVGRRGTIYGTRRLPPVEVNEAPEDRDEEIKMSEQTPERVTYEQALAKAVAHAKVAEEYAGSSRADYQGKAQANAQTSRAWSALAGLIRADEVRANTAAYVEQLTQAGLTATARKRREPAMQAVTPDA